MSRLENTRRIGFLASLMLMLVAVQGCSVDTPTAPDQVPGPPPTTGGNNWKITVSVNPDTLEVDADVPATVTVNVESRSDGSNPPNGTTMSLSTSLGQFETSTAGGPTVVAVAINRGKATALLFAGETAAGGTVTARLEGSEGRRGFTVSAEAQDPFITAITPNSGSESGGTSVTIQGANFAEPLRVSFTTGNVEKLATVTSVSDTLVRVITPPAGEMDDEDCDFDNDGTADDGKRLIDTPATVTVEYLSPSGEILSGEIDGAFTYTPNSNSCKDAT